MASPRSWPYDDEDRPSGSVRPLSQADLQAILAHLDDDPDELLAGTGVDRPVVAVRVRATVGRPGGSAQARWRRLRAAEWAPGPVPCPGESPPPSGSARAGESSAACWRPDWGWSSACWWPWRPAGRCGSSPARTPSPGGAAQRGSDTPPGCSTRWNGTAGPSCMTWPSRVARPTLTIW